MKRKWWIFAIAIILIAIVVVGIANSITSNKDNEQTQTEKFKIVTSFYPIYGMVANLTQNAQNVELTNMTETNVGCLHDYTLTTADMKKIEDADALIQNGLGLEEFMDKIIQTYPDLKIINSSEQVTNILTENEQNNPHIWTSIQNYKQQVQTTAQKLIEYNPENTSIYQTNCQQYLQKLQELQNNYKEQVNLKGQKAICLNEALTYLAEELEMDVTTVQTNHEESTLSADSLKDLISKMQNENIQIILIDKEDNTQNAETLANETGAKIYKLDSAMSGSGKLDDYYLSMQNNLEILKHL